MTPRFALFIGSCVFHVASPVMVAGLLSWARPRPEFSGASVRLLDGARVVMAGELSAMVAP